MYQFGWKKWLQWDKNGLNMVEKLYFREKREVVLLRIRCRQLRILLYGVLALIVIFVFCLLSGGQRLIRNGVIKREGEMSLDVLVEMEKGGVKSEEKIHLYLPQRNLTEAERQKYKNEVERQLKKAILGQNADLSHVYQDLYFPQTLGEEKIPVKWVADDEYVGANGKLKKSKIPPEGVSVSIIAAIDYRGWKEQFCISVFLLAEPPNEQELMLRLVEKEIRKSIQSQSELGQVRLPGQMEGISVNYKEVGVQTDLTPVCVLAAALILLPFLWREREKKMLTKRRRQLLLDYPGFVNQLVLLLSAGMNIRGALERISQEYEDKRKQGMSNRYLYEELWGLCQDIRNGLPEPRAIEAFGNRCQLLPFTKFATILCQSRRRSMAGVIQMLETEASETFERRKEQVKRLGEEAATKMLFPLLLMLVLVVGIIMIPAFLTL